MRVALLSTLSVLIAVAAESPVKVEMKNTKGEPVGTAEFREQKGNVVIQLNLDQLPPGTRAVHLHQNPRCDPPDFQSAGPHFNPHKKQHGSGNPEGPHAGDLPNIKIGSNGRVKTTLRTKLVTLGEGENSLFANGGTALVIHASADDMKSDPAGNAGDRIACGVIAKPGEASSQ